MKGAALPRLFNHALRNKRMSASNIPEDVRIPDHISLKKKKTPINKLNDFICQ